MQCFSGLAWPVRANSSEMDCVPFSSILDEKLQVTGVACLGYRDNKSLKWRSVALKDMLAMMEWDERKLQNCSSQ